MSELSRTLVNGSSDTPADAEPQVVVASVPASHVYVRHIAAEVPDGVVRLSDPDPDSPERSTEQKWWPPVMLHPEWVANHDFDVFHVQFGFDAWSPDELRNVVDAVHSRGRAVVYTAHDLRNPHHSTREMHDAQLQVLVDHADAVLTLTPGAANEIEDRWGRRVQVLPHPHVVDFATMSKLAGESEHETRRPFRVGLHVKSLRASMDPLTILPTLVRTVRDLPDAVLQVNGHRDVLERGGARFDPALHGYLQTAAREGHVELHVHDFMSDAELWSYLRALDVSVLPYRFGTHSGWLEACRDLGTAVVAPTCGFFAEQGPVHSYVQDEASFEETSLARALREAHEEGPVDPLTIEDRRRQRAFIASEHRALYGALS